MKNLPIHLLAVVPKTNAELLPHFSTFSFNSLPPSVAFLQHIISQDPYHSSQVHATVQNRCKTENMIQFIRSTQQKRHQNYDTVILQSFQISQNFPISSQLFQRMIYENSNTLSDRESQYLRLGMKDGQMKLWVEKSKHQNNRSCLQMINQFAVRARRGWGVLRVVGAHRQNTRGREIDIKFHRAEFKEKRREKRTASIENRKGFWGFLSL